jgi:hypothetical protein
MGQFCVIFEKITLGYVRIVQIISAKRVSCNDLFMQEFGII